MFDTECLRTQSKAHLVYVAAIHLFGAKSRTAVLSRRERRAVASGLWHHSRRIALDESSAKSDFCEKLVRSFESSADFDWDKQIGKFLTIERSIPVRVFQFRGEVAKSRKPAGSAGRSPFMNYYPRGP